MSDSNSSRKRSRLEITAEKAAKLNNRLRELKEQKKRKDRQVEYAATRRERKADGHRKILVGAIVLKVAREKPKAAGWLSDLLKRQSLSERDADVLKPVLDELERVRGVSKEHAPADSEAETAEPVS